MPFFRSSDLAVDLGTARIRVAGGRPGVCENRSNHAAGAALKQGVVINADVAVDILRPMIQRRRRLGARKMRVLACAPTDVSALERNLIRSCLLEAGAGSVVIVPEPLAAAVGSGVDIGSRYAKFLVDFGEGVTDCAVIREGQVAASMAERMGCADLRRIIRGFAASTAGLEVSESEADRILRSQGLRREGEVRTWGFTEGRQVALSLKAADLQDRLWPTVSAMLAPIKTLLRNMTAGSGAEIIEDGIFLTGGGALLPGMREAVMAVTGIECRMVRDPLGAVICGASRMLPFAASLNLWKAWGSYQRVPASSGLPC